MSNIQGYTSIPRDNLTYEYLLNGDGIDTAGSADITLINPIWVGAEKLYSAKMLDLNGSTAYGTVTHSYSGNFTIGVWVNFDTFKSNDESQIYRITGSGTTNIGFSHYNVSGTNQFQLYVNDGTTGSSLFLTTLSPTTGEWYFIVARADGTNRDLIVYDKQLTKYITTTTNEPSVILSGTANIGRHPTVGTRYLDGKMSGLRICTSYAMSDNELYNLAIEGLRRLGNSASYPTLMRGLVGYIRAEDGGTVLYDLINGTIPTYVGGSATTDNLGYNKAISNPNYTWTSITYTTGYTFEDSGAGWNIVTSPTGLSATGINRTTTLRDIYLFNRTLSADETTLLETLCNKYYPFPFCKYSLPNLQDGLVMHLDGDGNDISGNGNSGTPTNVSVVRRNQSSGGSYNGSTSRITGIPAVSNAGFTLSMIVKQNSSSFQYLYNLRETLANVNNRVIFYDNSGTLRFLNTIGGVTNIIEFTYDLTQKYQYLAVTHDGINTARMFIDGVEVVSGNVGAIATVYTNPSYRKIGIRADDSSTTAFDGKIYEPKIWNRELSTKEVEQDFYAGFIGL